MTPDWITAAAAMVAAVGGIVAAVLAYRSKHAAEASAAKLTIVEGVVMELGPALDGRLSELIRAEIGKARAEGLVDGAQAQRDRDETTR